MIDIGSQWEILLTYEKIDNQYEWIDNQWKILLTYEKIDCQYEGLDSQSKTLTTNLKILIGNIFISCEEISLTINI